MISIETINGKKVTVIWHRDNEFPRTVEAVWSEASIGYTKHKYRGYQELIATALPPLPRHPKPSDACLLYRYMAEGLELKFRLFDDGKEAFIEDCDLATALSLLSSPTQTYEVCNLFGENPVYRYVEITHATYNGERVEIAIKEKDND